MKENSPLRKLRLLIKGIFSQSMKELGEVRKALTFFLYKLIKTVYVHLHVRKLTKKMMEAKNYKEWEETGKEMDGVLRNNKWKAEMRSRNYDYKNVNYMYLFLKELRRNDLAHGLTYTLRSNLCKNMYGIANPVLYE
ncbi:unnamed protein product [Moneuplotes crassus]|uniref:Triacylglycerol lipase N-terminal domain-containing protein n=1 Tax=Euplotes crassus TaxID=5936 RepID=A0AAD1U5K0_EUPCR|nr:unnamed protein product [Moneuplotes crassus]